MNDPGKNPFELVTASKLSAQEATDLWCDDKRLDRVTGRETCFIHGHRGTGKSMLFRVLQRDCQELLYPNRQSTFLSIYFSVRDSEILVEELKHFQSDLQRYIICESQLSLLIVKQLLLIIRDRPDIVPDNCHQTFIDLVAKRTKTAYRFSNATSPTIVGEELAAVVLDLIEVIEVECQRIRDFIGRSLLFASSPAYDGPLFLYDSLLGPIADFFSDRVGVCLYFLVDDGDDLPLTHTEILNTWIARRRKSAVFKVSTMYTYKTWRTRSGSAIQQAHDFIQYDIATRFLEGKGENYVGLLKEICRKRLGQAGVMEPNGTVVDPTRFFPKDDRQERRIQEVQVRLKKEYAQVYTGRAVSDNVYRHTMSEYLRELKRRRALHKFSYAGFTTLAILSGGLVRDFIVCAQQMFDNASRRVEGGAIRCVPPEIQNETVRVYADRLLDRVGDSRQKRVRDTGDWRKVANLVKGLGVLFKRKLLSKDSERRVFSFALQSPPNEKLLKLLKLGISEGYFMKGFIATKEGTGRRALYVLTRRLAPCFSLDVSSYSGYLSCTPDVIERLANEGPMAKPEDISSTQMELFQTDDGSMGAYEWLGPDDVEVW